MKFDINSQIRNRLETPEQHEKVVYHTMPPTSLVFWIHSLSGSSFRFSLKAPANTPPKKAKGSCKRRAKDVATSTSGKIYLYNHAIWCLTPSILTRKHMQHEPDEHWQMM